VTSSASQGGTGRLQEDEAARMAALPAGDTAG
jgi:hypothetical protein